MLAIDAGSRTRNSLSHSLGVWDSGTAALPSSLQLPVGSQPCLHPAHLGFACAHLLRHFPHAFPGERQIEDEVCFDVLERLDCPLAVAIPNFQRSLEGFAASPNTPRALPR